MADDLQDIVDNLAERLQRSVAIDDPNIRLLAASRHFGDEDASRVSSVLNRSVAPQLCEQILAQGIAQWTTPGRVIVPLEGTLPRLCIPIRCAGLLLGYLWLIDPDSTLGDRDQDIAREAAERAGVVLYRQLIVHERSRARHEAILRELVATDRAIRSQAVDDLRAEQLFPTTGMYFQVLGMQHQGPDGIAAPQTVAMEAAVEDAQSWMSQRSAAPACALMATNKSRAWLMLAQPQPPSRRELDTICSRLTARFDRLTQDGVQLVLGIGGLAHRVEDIVESYRQAFLAVRAAQLVPSIGPVARWGALGPYQLLLRMPTEDLLAAAQVPALVTLDKEDGHRGLVATLEAFLDNAGDVARTARNLNVHRATLYHRLKRIEQLTGCELSRGDDRLTLHLGLKLRALAAAHRNETTLTLTEDKPARMRSVS
ncbi:PucR family transcriptional regulator [Prauserella endophytica]|uniref:CdaR family transcriptional regulator n=1 Tax=Prauserella endophytica TaxID=1592324 RepID=A0ABY2S4A1_9PSEU|nr:helix-turn-helix domain-containing protein [Prauserella endophytica]PXY23352.1 CdaR family transcriptional regulator [Prauserella coralliicola]TKG70561.1 CdaR family transcriptional regulator [Prauserella endophytica]